MHFLLVPKHHWSDLLKQCNTLACTLQKGRVFSGFVFHLVQNVYHKPGPPAAGHLIFADSAHSRSLPHPSVKSREQTQSNSHSCRKQFFVLLRKQYLVTHSKSCAPCLGFKDLHQRMGSLPFHLNLSPLPPGPQAWLDPKDLCMLPDVLCTSVQFGSVQSPSHVQLFAISWGVACQVSLSITNSWSLLKLIFMRSVMPPNNFIFYLPLCLLLLIFPCIRVFSNVSVLPIRWPKYWRFSFNIGPSNEYSGLISFFMEWLDLLAVQGTLKSLV